MTTGSASALCQPERWLTCYPIRPGDTAAGLAYRFTGNAHNRHQPWFQIVEPTTATLIPKSQYGRIQAGWHVCVATGMLRLGSARRPYAVGTSGPLVVLQRGVRHEQAAIDLSVLWWAIPLFAVSGLVLARVLARKYMVRRRARLETMKGFGDRFISEFERPLFRRCVDEPSVRSRLRLAPRRRTVEVLLAPADGRTYPNLSDHRKNVEYDVERVLRLLRHAPFKTGPLYAEGPWVVIPFRLESDRQQEGVP
jgi:hypothetical protein